VTQTKTTQLQPQATTIVVVVVVVIVVVVVVVVARKSSLREPFYRTLLSACLVPGLIQPQLDVDRDERRYLPTKHINLGNRRQET